MTIKLQTAAAALRLRANEIDKMGDAIDRVRFCRNVLDIEDTPEQPLPLPLPLGFLSKESRQRQFMEAVDSLLSL